MLRLIIDLAISSEEDYQNTKTIINKLYTIIDATDGRGIPQKTMQKYFDLKRAVEAYEARRRTLKPFNLEQAQRRVDELEASIERNYGMGMDSEKKEIEILRSAINSALVHSEPVTKKNVQPDYQLTFTSEAEVAQYLRGLISEGGLDSYVAQVISKGLRSYDELATPALNVGKFVAKYR